MVTSYSTGKRMGLGDWIMASATVKEVNEKTGKKVALGDGSRAYLDPNVFANNPRMATDDKEEIEWVKDYPGHRPYIKGQTPNRKIIFNDDFKPKPGEIYLSDAEKTWADEQISEPFILVEPNVKTVYKHTVNKAWHQWEELLKNDLPWVQIGDARVKKYTKWIETTTFRQALAILNKATLFVGTDGGLHHAAAALGIPAVVIWTGFTSPKHLGYDNHVNLYHGGEPCGTFGDVCKHCRENSDKIKPDFVLQAIHDELERIVIDEERKRDMAT